MARGGTGLGHAGRKRLASTGPASDSLGQRRLPRLTPLPPPGALLPCDVFKIKMSLKINSAKRLHYFLAIFPHLKLIL